MSSILRLGEVGTDDTALADAARAFFAELGYESEREWDRVITSDEFIKEEKWGGPKETKAEEIFRQHVKNIPLLFEMQKEELDEALARATGNGKKIESGKTARSLYFLLVRSRTVKGSPIVLDGTPVVCRREQCGDTLVLCREREVLCDSKNIVSRGERLYCDGQSVTCSGVPVTVEGQYAKCGAHYVVYKDSQFTCNGDVVGCLNMPLRLDEGTYSSNLFEHTPSSEQDFRDYRYYRYRRLQATYAYGFYRSMMSQIALRLNSIVIALFYNVDNGTACLACLSKRSHKRDEDRDVQDGCATFFFNIKYPSVDDLAKLDRLALHRFVSWARVRKKRASVKSLAEFWQSVLGTYVPAEIHGEDGLDIVFF